tara:strand:- start:119 stop:559 length:441 start_codon:yes stop_codon:yes gene_type:complete
MRGTVNVPHGVKKTLKLLNLETRYRATVISDTKINQGMLLKAKEYLAWTKADSKIIAKLLKNKGEKSKTIKYSNDLVKQIGFNDIDDLAQALLDNKISISKISNLKPSFRLSPPRGGFKKSTRRMYSQGGTLGYNPDLLSILSNMM